MEPTSVEEKGSGSTNGAQMQVSLTDFEADFTRITNEAKEKVMKALRELEERDKRRVWLAHMEGLKKYQEYVPVGFPRTRHLPVVFRVSLKEPHGNLGYAVWTEPDGSKVNYAFAFLDRIYNHYNRADYPRNSLYVWWHEFLHLYFKRRFDNKADTFDYKINKKTGKMEKLNYRQNRSRGWSSNERIIQAVGIAMMEATYSDEWLKLVTE